MASDGDKLNMNLFPLEKTENSINQAVRALRQIDATDGIQTDLKESCLADLKELQDGNLLALRRALE